MDKNFVKIALFIGVALITFTSLINSYSILVVISLNIVFVAIILSAYSIFKLIKANNCNFQGLIDDHSKPSANKLSKQMNTIYRSLGYVFLNQSEKAQSEIIAQFAGEDDIANSLKFLKLTADFYIQTFQGNFQNAVNILNKMRGEDVPFLNKSKWILKYELVLLFHEGKYADCEAKLALVKKYRWPKMDRMEHLYIEYQLKIQNHSFADKNIAFQFNKIKGDCLVYQIN